MSPHVRETKTVMDSGFHAVDSGFRLLDSRSFSGLDSRFQLSFRMGMPRIPDSTSQKFPRFRIPQAKIALIPLHGENIFVPPVWYVHFDTISYVTFRILLWLVHDYLSHCMDTNYSIVVRKAK